MNNAKTFTIAILILLTGFTFAHQQSWQDFISINEVSENTSNTEVSTFSHIISGEDRLLIVGISLETGDESKRVNTITYSGQNLTRVGEVRGPSNDPRVDVWSLVNPPAGTSNVIITLFEDNKIAATAISFIGVDQSNPISNVKTAGGSEGTPYLLIPSAANNLVIDFVASLADQINTGPSQTEISNQEMFDSGKRGGVSIEQGNANVEMTWLGSEKWAAVGFSINSSGITDVNENQLIPEKIELKQNYPNPFNPVTRISYLLPAQSTVSLKIYNVLGIEMRSLVNETQQAGLYQIEFNAEELSSGIYFYRLEAFPEDLSLVKFVETKQMILLK